MRERPDSKAKRAKREEIKENCNRKYNYMVNDKINNEVRERFFRPAYEIRKKRGSDKS